ncbi:MAG: DUF1232 domain-containing protein [Spirochaetes bacterium]|nr:DUF1232 domain-containing protein [Spirochaetota bacterium]
MKLLDNITIKMKKLKKEITALYYAYQNPEVKILPKFIIIIALGYALSPIDLIPDFIPVLGYMDDLLIIPALITLSIKLIPPEILEESKRKAEEVPLLLKKNWFAALVFILIWIILLAVMIRPVLKLVK